MSYFILIVTGDKIFSVVVEIHENEQNHSVFSW